MPSLPKKYTQATYDALFNDIALQRTSNIDLVLAKLSDRYHPQAIRKVFDVMNCGDYINDAEWARDLPESYSEVEAQKPATKLAKNHDYAASAEPEGESYEYKAVTPIHHIIILENSFRRMRKLENTLSLALQCQQSLFVSSSIALALQCQQSLFVSLVISSIIMQGLENTPSLSLQNQQSPFVNFSRRRLEKPSSSHVEALMVSMSSTQHWISA